MFQLNFLIKFGEAGSLGIRAIRNGNLLVRIGHGTRARLEISG